MRCKLCKEKFIPKFFLQKYCMDKDECIKEAVSIAKDKKWKSDKKEMKASLMTKGEHLILLQAVFNTFIRERDKNDPCISCGTKTANKWDAGHFYPTTYSYLRFNEDNVHRQCSKGCNLEKHGNLQEYRPRLIEKIGLQRVLALDNRRHLKLELSIPEIQELTKEYRFKTKELKKLNS